MLQFTVKTESTVNSIMHHGDDNLCTLVGAAFGRDMYKAMEKGMGKMKSFPNDAIQTNDGGDRWAALFPLDVETHLPIVLLDSGL